MIYQEEQWRAWHNAVALGNGTWDLSIISDTVLGRLFDRVLRESRHRDHKSQVSLAPTRNQNNTDYSLIHQLHILIFALEHTAFVFACLLLMYHTHYNMNAAFCVNYRVGLCGYYLAVSPMIVCTYCVRIAFAFLPTQMNNTSHS